MSEKKTVIDEKTGMTKRVYSEMPKGKGSWKRKTKGQKIASIVGYVLIAALVVGLFLIAFSRNIWGDDIGDKLLGEGVSNGFVAMWNKIEKSYENFMWTVIIILIFVVGAFIINTIIRSLTNKTNKSRTIGSLLRSIVKYVCVIIAVAVILSRWGVDVTSIVAGLGILTLIIGLGCQTLIQDIISGLFIVFDDYFTVGDMVIIDGFRGYVTEIGLKTVKIDDHCGNVKSITNSSINTVVNLSKQLNLISVSLDTGYNEDLDRVEGIIERELPKIKERIPKIVEGPFYKGVEGFSAGGVTLGFGCYCKCEDRFQVYRDFNREIYRMYLDNDIWVPFNQIVINPADPTADKRPHATAKDKKDAKILNDKNRIPAPAPKKEKSFIKRAESTIKEEKKSL